MKAEKQPGPVSEFPPEPPVVVSSILSLERTMMWSWDLRGPETKIYCAGKGQQQLI
jgi:hypothetical protein